MRCRNSSSTIKGDTTLGYVPLDMIQVQLHQFAADKEATAEPLGCECSAAIAGARLAKQVTLTERRLAALREAYTAGQAALSAAADRVEIVSNTLGKSREDAATAAAANQMTR